MLWQTEQRLRALLEKGEVPGAERQPCLPGDARRCRAHSSEFRIHATSLHIYKALTATAVCRPGCPRKGPFPPRPCLRLARLGRAPGAASTGGRLAPTQPGCVLPAVAKRAVTTTSPALSFSPREPFSEVKAELQLDSSWKPKPVRSLRVSGDRDRRGAGCPAADSQGLCALYGAAVLTPERCISLDTRLGFPGGARRRPSAPTDLQSRRLGKEPPAKLPPRPIFAHCSLFHRRHGLGCFSRLPCHQSCPHHPNWLPPIIPEVSTAAAPTHISLSLVPSTSRVQALRPERSLTGPSGHHPSFFCRAGLPEVHSPRHNFPYCQSRQQPRRAPHSLAGKVAVPCMLASFHGLAAVLLHCLVFSILHAPSSHPPPLQVVSPTLDSSSWDTCLLRLRCVLLLQMFSASSWLSRLSRQCPPAGSLLRPSQTDRHKPSSSP